MQYIAYYRVSTDRQGRSGLGLDAQRAAVAGYTQGRGEIIAEYTEVESGKKNDRPQLVEALNLCRQKKARLVIAKLDRLARNVAFIASLMDGGVDFTACDMPEANRLTLHILAAVAEHEREMISRRTKDALAAAKVRGQKLGNPSPALAAAKARVVATAHLDQYRHRILPIIAELHSQGLGLSAIAREMNRRDIPTARGRQWEPATVRLYIPVSAKS